MDFAENWTVFYNKEPQSTYYAREAVTLQSVVIHIRIGEATIHKCVALVTDEHKHDTGAIMAFLHVVKRWLRKTPYTSIPKQPNTTLQIPFNESVSGQDKNHGLDGGEEGGGNRAG